MTHQTSRRAFIAGASTIALAPLAAHAAAGAPVTPSIGADLLRLITEVQRVRAAGDVIHARCKADPTSANAEASDLATEHWSNAQWAVMNHPARNLTELRLKLAKAEDYEIIGDVVAEHLWPIVIADLRRISGEEA